MSELIEQVARKFHETYERLAPQFGYETRRESAKPWSEVPENNRKLMMAVCAEVLRELSAKLDTRWEDWRKQLLDAWAKDHRATMTALLEGGPTAPPMADAKVESRVAALEQRIAELEANLVRYGEHEVIDGQFACASFDKQPCNCGFEAALARLREVKGEIMIAKIKCDRTVYALPQGRHSGENLRTFFGVPASKDLWWDDDECGAVRIDGETEAIVSDGDRFFTAFKKINS